MRIVFDSIAIILILLFAGVAVLALGENDVLQNENANLIIENKAQKQEIEIWETLNATQNI
ncbi:MAG: hypothetical protein FD128_2852, partial [Hyphomonadaceae bacterium]